MKPLKKWICDYCGKAIDDVEHGYVIWVSDNENQYSNFMIIHQKICDRFQNTHANSLPLKSLLGSEGQAKLLSFISVGKMAQNIGCVSHSHIKDFDEFVDFFRRLQTPYYEEARQKFSDPDLQDYFSNNQSEDYFYIDSMLKEICEKFKD